MNSANPLLQSQTKPGIFVKLPSGGRFYKNKPTLTADGEIEVLPMNAIDELHMLNPEGLINNESLFNVLKHVAPGIKDVREILNPDLDVLFIAMRIITYGDDMNITAKCKECKEENTYVMPLTKILSTITEIPDENIVIIDKYTITVRPQTLYSQTKLNDYMINIRRAANKLASLNNDNSNLEEMDMYKQQMANAVTESSQELFNIAADSILSVEIDDNKVTDKKFILEWLKTIAAPEYDKIRNTIQKLSEQRINREFHYKCVNEGCLTDNKMEVDFDPANFFEIS